MELPQGDPGWDANGAPAGQEVALQRIVERTCAWERCRRVFAPGRPNQKFCGKACRMAEYEHNHPRLGLPPVIPEGRSLDRLIALAADGRFRTIPEMAHETGTREATVARRIQESQSGRKGRAMARFTWDVRVRAHSKAREYRLVLRG